MDTVTFLGTRGSVSSVGVEYTRFGGNTTCILVQLAGETILLDAGTGLMNYPQSLLNEKRRIPLLLSHPHADHLVGLPLSPLVMNPEIQVDFYSKTRGGMDACAQIERLVSPPLWPVRMEELPAKVSYHELPDHMQLGAVTVDVMEGCHPGGVSLMRLTGGGNCIVFITDCTLTDELFPRLTAFAGGCSLLLCDGQYSDEEWPSRSDFGHSTWRKAALLGVASGAKKVRIIHHDPSRTDRMLEEAEPELAEIHPDCHFAMDREEIAL